MALVAEPTVREAIVDRHARDFGMTEREAADVLADGLNFLSSVAKVAMRSHRPTVPVDNALCTLILFSSDYERYCVHELGAVVDRVPDRAGSALRNTIANATYEAEPIPTEHPASPRPAGASLIDHVLSYPLDETIRLYAEKFRLPESLAERHGGEFRRYLALCVVHPDAGYGMAGPVDELWHLFLQDTRAYRAFCRETLGRFVYHAPRIDSDGESDDDSYGKMLRAYEGLYGEPAPRDIWPRLRTQQGAPDCSGSQCGGGTQCASCSKGSCGPSCSPSPCGAQGCSDGGD